MNATVERLRDGYGTVLRFEGGPLAHPQRFRDTRDLGGAWRWATLRGLVPVNMSYAAFTALVPAVGEPAVELPA